MTFFAVTLGALAPLFLLILLGYGLKRLRVLHPAHVPVLNGLVLNVTLPALIVQGLMGAPRLPLADALPPLALILAQGVTLALAYGAGRAFRMTRPVQGALLMTATFGNTGFLGYPIALALLPQLFPTTILLDQFGMTIMLYFTAAIVGARLGTSGGGTGDVRAAILRFLRGPLFLSVVVGTLARLVPWPPALLHLPGLPQIGRALMQCLKYLGQGTTPLVLLALGVALRPGAARAYAGPLAAACALKLLVTPLAMWAVLRVFGLHGDLLTTSVLSAAMPTAVTASVLSADHDLAGDYAVGVVFASTILSAVTVPLLLSVLR